MQFKYITGREEVKYHFIKSINDGRVSHAQLFLSAEGTGALAMAIAYAQYLNCIDRQETDSCGVCESCRKYEKLIHPDLHFSFPYAATDKDDISNNYLPQWRKIVLENPYFNLDDWRNALEIEKKQVNINAAECYNILRKISLKAFEASYKVQIIWLPEYLGKESNRLLKVIEEPPQNTLFILVAENQDRLLNTILSRTQMIKIPKPNAQLIADYLQDKQGITESKAAQISFLADGNMAEALHLCSGEENEIAQDFADWLRQCFNTRQLIKTIDFCDIFSKKNRDNQKNFFKYAINYFREIFLIAQGSKNMVRLSPKELEMAEKLAAKVLNNFMIEQAIEAFELAIFHIERNANAKILFLDVSLQLNKIFTKVVQPETALHLLT